MDQFEGSCMCGGVAFAAHTPRSIFHCHCESCRRSTGQASVAFASFAAADVTFSGIDRKIYESSPGVGRAFCPDCGTPIAWQGRGTKSGVDLIEIYLGTFVEREKLQPTFHVFYEERVPWFDVADGLPRYRGVDVETAAMAHGPAKLGLPGMV